MSHQEFHPDISILYNWNSLQKTGIVGNLSDQHVIVDLTSVEKCWRNYILSLHFLLEIQLLTVDLESRKNVGDIIVDHEKKMKCRIFSSPFGVPCKKHLINATPLSAQLRISRFPERTFSGTLHAHSTRPSVLD